MINFLNDSPVTILNKLVVIGFVSYAYGSIFMLVIKFLNNFNKKLENSSVTILGRLVIVSVLSFVYGWTNMSFLKLLNDFVDLFN